MASSGRVKITPYYLLGSRGLIIVQMPLRVLALSKTVICQEDFFLNVRLLLGRHAVHSIGTIGHGCRKFPSSCYDCVMEQTGYDLSCKRY